MRFRLKILLVLLSFPLSLRAAFVNVEVGARPMGMGGAFVAVADDINSLYYNPAGLSQIKKIQLTSWYDRPFGVSDLNMEMLAASYHLKKKGTIALGFKAFNMAEYYSEMLFTLGHGFDFRNVNLGYSISLMRLSINDIGVGGYNYGTAYDIGLNGGLLFSVIPKRLKVGIYFSNINSPRIGKNDPEYISKSVEAGMAFYPNKRLKLAAEVYQDIGSPLQLKIGQEFEVNKYLSLRTGIQSNPSRITLGLGFHFQNFMFDYAYYDHESLPATHYFSFTVAFGKIQSEESNGAFEGGLLNINKASAGELMQLPRVGPSLANRIIDYRTQNNGFKTIDEIKNVRGIGNATFAKLSDLITTGKVKTEIVHQTVPESEKVNINSASELELQSLPGIGASTAKKIVNYRDANGQFKSIEGLTKVRGIGSSKFGKIENLITVGAGGSAEQSAAGKTAQQAQNVAKININTATVDELMKLPKMRKRIADAIVQYRKRRGSFDKKEDLLYIPYISQTYFNTIKDLIMVTKEVQAVKEKLKTVEEEYKLDVNNAGVADFEDFGISEEFAKKIVDYRTAHGPFKKVDDVRTAAGMDAESFNIIKDFLLIKGQTSSETVPPTKVPVPEQPAKSVPVETGAQSSNVDTSVKPETSAQSSNVTSGEGKVNINTATVKQLTAVAVSEEVAKKIVDYQKQGKKFKSLDDLKTLGITADELNLYKEFLTVK